MSTTRSRPVPRPMPRPAAPSAAPVPVPMSLAARVEGLLTARQQEQAAQTPLESEVALRARRQAEDTLGEAAAESPQVRSWLRARAALQNAVTSAEAEEAQLALRAAEEALTTPPAACRR